MSYAEGTAVTPERSQLEIATLIRKYGAKSFATGWDGDRALVEFIAHERQIRFVLELPNDPADFATTPGGKFRPIQQRQPALEQETRRRWRALALAIKAKLEVVETGISTFEAEFMPHTVMPDGRTVAEHILPVVARAYELNKMPSTFLAIEAAS